MELPIQDEQLKLLIKAALVEVITERQELFVEIFREAMEDLGLGQAIEEGLKNDPVSRDQVFDALSN